MCQFFGETFWLHSLSYRYKQEVSLRR
jgi:hypothetical protein